MPVRRSPHRPVLVVVGAAFLALAITGLVRAESYAPLRVTAFGPGYASFVPRMTEDGLVMRIDGEKHRTGEAQFVVRNSGRWAITIDRPVGLFPCPPSTPEDLQGTGGCAQLVALRQPPRRIPGGYALSTARFRPVHVPAGGTAGLWARVSGRCWHSKSDPAARNGVGITFYGVRVHYTYLGVFGRTADLAWPVGLEFRC